MNGCLEHLNKDGLLKGVGDACIPWLSIDEGILKLREMLEWAPCDQPNSPPWAGPEYRPLTGPIRCKMVRAPELVFVSIVPELRVGDTAALLDEQNVMILIGSWSSSPELSKTR